MSMPKEKKEGSSWRYVNKEQHDLREMGRGRKRKWARQKSRRQKSLKAAGHRYTCWRSLTVTAHHENQHCRSYWHCCPNFWGEMGIKWNCNHTWKELLTKFLRKRTQLLWQKTDVKEHICQVFVYTALSNSRKDDSGEMELQSINCNRMMREKYSM